MFFKKESLQEAPLGYWEEYSYMLVVPKDDNEDLVSGIFEKVSDMNDVELIEKKYLSDEEPGSMKVAYKGEEYEVSFYPGNFSIPEYYLKNNLLFREDEVKAIMNAKKCLTLFMKFNKNSQKCYHLQLKLALATVPDLIGVLDESAEKMLPGKWVRMTAESKIIPSSKHLFTVQAVSGEQDEVWLHTHGLCRCGITELEILQSSKENYRNHYNLINTYAMYLIDKNGELDPRVESAYIGILVSRDPIVVTCKSWTEGLKEYKKLDLGGLKDRKDGHNSKTSIIFLYKNEEDEKKGKLSKVSVYDEMWGDNPIFFISDNETARMKALAMERFNYVREYSKNSDNQIIIKIGLKDPEEKLEHIWFELLGFDSDKFKAKLTQDPYNDVNMKKDDEAWFTVDDVTDWLIYTKNATISPDNVYIIQDK